MKCDVNGFLHTFHCFISILIEARLKVQFLCMFTKPYYEIFCSSMFYELLKEPYFLTIEKIHVLFFC
jgi:hypothetical protein